MDRRVLEAKDFQVRNYHRSDRESVRAICCETGFLGNPIDPVFEDRELFADFLTDYYLKHEPDSAFVVVKGNVVKGYLLGSRRPLSYQVHGSEVHPGLPSTPRDLFPLSARSWRQTGPRPDGYIRRQARFQTIRALWIQSAQPIRNHQISTVYRSIGVSLHDRQRI